MAALNQLSLARRRRSWARRRVVRLCNPISKVDEASEQTYRECFFIILIASLGPFQPRNLIFLSSRALVASKTFPVPRPLARAGKCGHSRLRWKQKSVSISSVQARFHLALNRAIMRDITVAGIVSGLRARPDWVRNCRYAKKAPQRLLHSSFFQQECPAQFWAGRLIRQPDALELTTWYPSATYRFLARPDFLRTMIRNTAQQSHSWIRERMRIPIAPAAEDRTTNGRTQGGCPIRCRIDASVDQTSPSGKHHHVKRNLSNRLGRVLCRR